MEWGGPAAKQGRAKVGPPHFRRRPHMIAALAMLTTLPQPNHVGKNGDPQEHPSLHIVQRKKTSWARVGTPVAWDLRRLDHPSILTRTLVYLYPASAYETSPPGYAADTLRWPATL